MYLLNMLYNYNIDNKCDHNCFTKWIYIYGYSKNNMIFPYQLIHLNNKALN